MKSLCTFNDFLTDRALALCICFNFFIFLNVFLRSVPFFCLETIEFVIECEHQKSPLSVQFRFLSAEKHGFILFLPTNVLHFFSCHFLCKIYRNSSILLFQGNVSPRLCFSLFSWLYLSFSSLYLQVFHRVKCLFWLFEEYPQSWLEVIWLCRLPLTLEQVS